jgi:transmembrane sensor
LTKEQIERFLRSECSLDEANTVIQYFEQHPEEIDVYLSDAEWEAFQAEAKLTAGKSADLWKNIEVNTIRPSKGRLVFLKPLLAAASVVLILFAGWWFLAHNNNSKVNTPVNNTESFANKFIQNTGTEMMLVKLPDSSSVQLMPASSISFTAPFQHKKREVELKGGAFFNVTKDSLQPFIVYSDAISTKVLGTQFLVTAFEKDNIIKVALFSGHVVVSSDSTLKKDVELFPGDVLLYDKTRKTADILAPKAVSAKTSVVKSKPAAVNYLSDNNWYMFNNQSLAEVFDQLQVLYSQKINYSKDDVYGLSFIGKIDKKDTLQNILEELCKLNNLKLNREQTGFVINKK